MSILHKILEEQFLIEISLQKFYDSYVDHKLIPLDVFNDLAAQDPTSKNGQRGKYLEGIINLIKRDKELDLHHVAEHETIKDDLEKFHRLSKGVSFTSFKTWREFFAYVDTLEETESNRQKKKKEKDIFNMPDDITVIDVTDEWICIETLTQEGNIKGAQYKTNPQANWCTAYLNTDSHWRAYSRSGDLLQFINVDDPFEKYQIYIKNGEIQESRDYNDRSDNKPYSIIEDLPNFTKNYGKIKERTPLKFIFDEEAAAHRMLDENWENEDDYLNRPRDEDEYEDYNIEEEWQINHWDRVIKEGFDIFKYSFTRNHKYHHHDNWADDRMPSFVDMFLDPWWPTEDEDKAWHEKEAKESVYDFYDQLQDKWMYWIEMESDSEPDEQSFQHTEDYHTAFSNWTKEDLEAFKEDNSDLFAYIEFFLESFPHDFKFVHPLPDSLTYMKDNESEQLKFKFESKNLFGKLLEGALCETEDHKQDIKVKCPKGFKVSVFKVDGGMYDCKVWKDSQLIIYTSNTAFDYSDQARAYGNKLAMICAGILPEWDNFKAWKNINLIENSKEISNVNVFNIMLEGAFSEEPPMEDESLEEPVDVEPEELIPEEEPEPELDSNNLVERPEKKTARLLSFDRVNANEELKQIIAQPLPQLPLDEIKNILNKYDLSLANENYVLPSDNGDVDLDIITTDGRTIMNSVIILYFSKIEGTETFNFSCYLS